MNRYNLLFLLSFISFINPSIKASEVKLEWAEIPPLSFIPKSYQINPLPNKEGIIFRIHDDEGITDEAYFLSNPKEARIAYKADCNLKTDITFTFTNSINKVKDAFKLFVDNDKNLLSVQYINTQCDVFLNFYNYTVQFGFFEDNAEGIRDYLNKEGPINSYFSSVKTPGKFWVWAKALSMDWSDIKCHWLRCDTQEPFVFGSLYHQALQLKDPAGIGIDKISYGFSTNSRLEVASDLIICAPQYKFISGIVNTHQLYLMDSFDLHVLYLTVKTPQKKLIRYQDFIVDSIENLGAAIKTTSNFWFVAKKLSHADRVKEVKANNIAYNLPLAVAPSTDGAVVYCNVDEVCINAKRLENFTLNNKTIYFQLCQIIRKDNYEAGVVENFHNFNGLSNSVFKQTLLKDGPSNSPKNLDEADLYVDFDKIKTAAEEEINNLRSALKITDVSIAKQLKGDKKHFKITPDNSEFWQNLLPFKDDIYTNAEEGEACRYYVWDKEFNDIDVYDSKGLHLGCINPLTGEVYHNKVVTRSIKLLD